MQAMQCKCHAICPTKIQPSVKRDWFRYQQSLPLLRHVVRTTHRKDCFKALFINMVTSWNAEKKKDNDNDSVARKKVICCFFLLTSWVAKEKTSRCPNILSSIRNKYRGSHIGSLGSLWNRFHFRYQKNGKNTIKPNSRETDLHFSRCQKKDTMKILTRGYLSPTVYASVAR